MRKRTISPAYLIHHADILGCAVLYHTKHIYIYAPIHHGQHANNLARPFTGSASPDVQVVNGPSCCGTARLVLELSSPSPGGLAQSFTGTLYYTGIAIARVLCNDFGVPLI